MVQVGNTGIAMHITAAANMLKLLSEFYNNDFKL